MHTSQYWYLQNHSLFKALNSEDLKQICYISKFRKAKKGEFILFTEESHGRVFTLKHGSIKIVRIENDGTEIVKDILKQGDMFGQLDLQNEEEDQYAVVLTEEAVFCSFKSIDFENFIKNKPEVAVKYTKWIGFWFKRLENRYSNIMFKDVKTRLLNFLQEIAIEGKVDKDGYVSMPNHLTHQDIASLICSTRQTVTSLINSLKTDETIQYSRKIIKIKQSVFLK